MKLYKPSWVNHDDKPIFSVDIHPDGERFATGGQGNESGLVVIWNLKPVLHADAEADKSVPKVLCQMDNHISCVNSVRWSNNGAMLASGGDDKIVMIWKRGKGGGGVFGSTGITKTVESWKCLSTLRGHSGDVLDLAWSPTDQWLASCSVDNTIIVWDIQSLPSIVARLKGHTGLVKGVTWDPVGKFLASQSDDKTVKIWKTSDWGLQKTITEPFDECGGTTHALRLSWSPDGQYLVSAHAMNGGGPTAQIIEREGWKCDKDFVGHRKAVTCVRFHNSILKRQAPKSNKSQQYCCVAVGSRDRSLSVWMTALQRPLVVIHDLFEDSVLDLSWSAHGYILLACSVDGTVVSLQFSANELGTPLTEDDKNALYQRMYGKSASIDMNAQVGKDMIIENADLLNTSNEKPKPPSLFETAEQSKSNCDNESDVFKNAVEIIPPPVTNTTPVKPISKQIETVTADGKRRITPMFIPLNPDDADASPEFSSSSRSTTDIVVERRKDEIKNDSFAKPAATEPAVSSLVDKPEILNLDSRLKKSAAIDSQITKIPLTSAIPTTNQKVEQISVVAKPLAMTGGKAVPLKGNHVKQGGDVRIQVLNGTQNTEFGALCKVTCCNIRALDKKLWETFIGSAVVNFGCCMKYTVICSIDGTIRFYNIKNGIAIFPVLNLSSPAVLSAFSLDCRLCGVLSECGSVRVWNIDTQSIFLTTSCCDLLKGGHPHMMSITENGYPFISLTNGCSYSYSKNLDSWLVLNSRDPIVRHGLTTRVTNTSNLTRNMKQYPLMSFQTTSHTFQRATAGQNFVDLSSNSSWQHSAKLSFIENQIELCKTINSPIELKHWYSMLGYHLSFHGTENRIRLLLDDLLGPTHSILSSSSSKKPLKNGNEILGIEKHEILNEVLRHFKTQHEWHRIWMEYSDQLSALNKLKNEAIMDVN